MDVMGFKIDFSKFKGYEKDGRKQVGEIYEMLSRLDSKLWEMAVLCYQEFVWKGKKMSLPILGFRTRKNGKALWIIGGIHGEEPAGVNAIAENVDFLNELAGKIPIVLLPLCNHSGYARDWRYPDKRRGNRKISVTDTEHLLQNFDNPKKARLPKPTCKESEALGDFIVRNSLDYEPMVALDFHEDDDSEAPYIYVCSMDGAEDSIALDVVEILLDNGMELQMDGKTRYGEDVINGMVVNKKDSTIDELMAAKKIISNGKIVKGPSAKTTVTVETNSKYITLKKRVEVHGKILRESGKYYEMAKKMN